MGKFYQSYWFILKSPYCFLGGWCKKQNADLVPCVERKQTDSSSSKHQISSCHSISRYLLQAVVNLTVMYLKNILLRAFEGLERNHPISQILGFSIIMASPVHRTDSNNYLVAVVCSPFTMRTFLCFQCCSMVSKLNPSSNSVCALLL